MKPKSTLKKRLEHHTTTLAKLMCGEKGFVEKIHNPPFVFHTMNRSAVMLMAREFGITSPELKKKITNIFNQATNQRLRGETISESYFRSRVVKLVTSETSLTDKKAKEFFSAVNGCLLHLTREVPKEIGIRQKTRNKDLE